MIQDVEIVCAFDFIQLPRRRRAHNECSSLCGAQWHNNEATSQWKAIVMQGLLLIS
jgi:hypothetical protein